MLFMEVTGKIINKKQKKHKIELKQKNNKKQNKLTQIKTQNYYHY